MLRALKSILVAGCVFTTVINGVVIYDAINSIAHADETYTQTFGAMPQQYGDPDQTQTEDTTHADGSHTTRTCVTHKFGPGMGWSTDCNDD